MRILALEPYHGGSHKAFLDGWIALSEHDWTVLGLPPFKWKWRMRHASVTFADAVRERTAVGDAWDVVFCSDMLNLPEFLGLAPEAVRRLPAVVYFHENQLTYPYQQEDERDYHYCFSNIWTALAADAVWFNSAYHRDRFLGAVPAFLRKMPDCRPEGVPDRIRHKASVHTPGIPLSVIGRDWGVAGYGQKSAHGSADPRAEPPDASDTHPALAEKSAERGAPTALGGAAGDKRTPGTLQPLRGPDSSPGHPSDVALSVEQASSHPQPPVRILWAARWEHDKGPDTFFEALDLLDRRGVRFLLGVIGEQFRTAPPIFDQASERFADRIVRWGYQESREAYETALQDADVFVSTAEHEFFGISAVEAVAAGCWPLLPRRLAYPEVFGGLEGAGHGPHFYEGGADELAAMLAILAQRVERGDLWQGEPERGVWHVERYAWPRRSAEMDKSIAGLRSR
jgi:glycosyltransferase involved in cell wall biosynthesis